MTTGIAALIYFRRKDLGRHTLGIKHFRVSSPSRVAVVVVNVGG